MSWLFQRDDFGDLVVAIADDLTINPAIVEKDYFVTEALRAICSKYSSDLIFKGGTSLAKGWGLINRFSEDIDLYINPGNRGEKARTRLLKDVVDVIAEHPAFAGGEPTLVSRVKGVARSARISYPSQNELSLVSNSVLIELGIQSGTFPCESRSITSIIAQALTTANKAPDQEDCRPFDLNVLHFRRTVVEKMFALHDKVERGLKKRNEPLGSYARHYYDISQLLGRPEVRNMLDSMEYASIVRDYYAVTRRYFPNQKFPENLELSNSHALFPTADIYDALAKDYNEQCNALCYGRFPEFSDVLSKLEDVRQFLVRVEPQE
ncbi:nucleotidyl transferase AbiEii/AbiGii toxin family protein [Kamptonema cortianum]|nr:nucleotidyl transferase AbiEii/AbiGii toxin family protein [Kamptonema cortianum]